MITTKQFRAYKKKHTIKECAKHFDMSTGKIYNEFGGIIKELQKEKREKLYNEIKQAALTGEFKAHIFIRYKTCAARANRLMEEFGEIKFRNRLDEITDRNNQIIEMFKEGKHNKSEIGRLFLLSRESVRLIIKKNDDLDEYLIKMSEHVFDD